MGGFVIQCKSDPEGQPVRIAANDFADLVASGSLSWPKLCVSDIDDRSKADWVIKFIALFQIIWFIAQLVGRAVEGLPVTTLELFTLGTVICATFTYCACLKKPFDVRTTLVVQSETILPASISTISRVGFSEGPMPVHQPWWLRMLQILIAFAFGGMHLLGWRFYFTTTLELWMWRASSLGCLVLPLIMFSIGYLDLRKRSRKMKMVVDFAWQMFFIPYALCRLYMFIEMFVGLRAVPVGVYQTPQWSQYFPSFG